MFRVACRGFCQSMIASGHRFQIFKIGVEGKLSLSRGAALSCSPRASYTCEFCMIWMQSFLASVLFALFFNQCAKDRGLKLVLNL